MTHAVSQAGFTDRPFITEGPKETRPFTAFAFDSATGAPYTGWER